MRHHQALLGLASLLFLVHCTSDGDGDGDSSSGGAGPGASSTASSSTSSSPPGSATSASGDAGSGGGDAPSHGSSGSGGSASTSSNSGGGSPSTSSGAGGSGVLRHGDEVTIAGDFGTEVVVSTFLGGADGAIEALGEGDTIPSGDGWSFDDYVTSGIVDPVRGMVLHNTEDDDHYNATRIFDAGEIPEQRSFYKAHWVRNVMRLDGAPYLSDYQWKHERVSWQYVWTDTDVEIKVHNWLTQGPMTMVNRSASDQETFWGGVAPDSNGDWALMEMIVTTGTVGGDDGLVVTRVHKDGQTQISQNLQPTLVYGDAGHRLRYFIEQNYFGNFAQIEHGVDNDWPHPDDRQVFSDDSRIIVGTTPETGRRRVELRDAVDLEQATVRELQSWTDWNGSITLDLNAGGLPPGQHELFLVVIDGIDADGWDVVVASEPVTVEVP